MNKWAPQYHSTKHVYLNLKMYRYFFLFYTHQAYLLFTKISYFCVLAQHTHTYHQVPIFKKCYIHRSCSTICTLFFSSYWGLAFSFSFQYLHLSHFRLFEQSPYLTHIQLLHPCPQFLIKQNKYKQEK